MHQPGESVLFCPVCPELPWLTVHYCKYVPSDGVDRDSGGESEHLA